MGFFVTNGQAAPDGTWSDFGLRYNDSNRRVNQLEVNNRSPTYWLHAEARLADGRDVASDYPPNQVTQVAVPGNANITIAQDPDNPGDPTSLTYTGVTRTWAWFFLPG